MPICGIATIIIVGILGLMGLYVICSVVFADGGDNSTGSKNADNNDINDIKDTEITSESSKKNTAGDSIRIKRSLDSIFATSPKWTHSDIIDFEKDEKLHGKYYRFRTSPENRGFTVSMNNFPLYAEIFAAGFCCEKRCRKSLDVDSDSSAFKIFTKYAKSFVGIGDTGFPDEFYHTFNDALYVRFLYEKTDFYSHLETPDFNKCKQDLDQVLGTFKGIAKKIAKVTPYPGFSYNSENEEMKMNLEEFIKSSKDVVERSVDIFNSLVDEHNVLTEKLIAEEKRKQQEERAMRQKSTEDEIVATLSVGTSQLSSSAARRKDLNSPVW
jgi:hypothetical protein